MWLAAAAVLGAHAACAGVERFKSEAAYVSRLVELGYVVLREDFEGEAFDHVRSVYPDQQAALSVTSRQVTWSSASHELWSFVPTSRVTTNPNWARGEGWGLYDTELASTIAISVPVPVYGVGVWVDTNPDFQDVGFLLRDRASANAPGYVLPGYGAMYPGDNAASGHAFIGIIDTSGFTNVVVTGTLEVNEENQLEGAAVLGIDDVTLAVDPAFLVDPLDRWRARHFAVAELLDPAKEGTLWGEDADPDTDGARNRHEFVADTDPADPSSFLGFSGATAAGGHPAVTWHGGVAATQVLERATDPAAAPAAWQAIFTNPPPTSVTAEFTDGPAASGPVYYRIRVVR